MNRFFSFIFLILPFFVISQEKETPVDSILNSKKDLFIKDYTKQFNVKLEFSNDIQEFEIPFGGKEVSIKPNLGYRYGVVLSYKFASVRVGIRPQVSSRSKEEKGDPESFRIKFQLLFDKWSHRFEYNLVKGYYVSDQNIGVGSATSNSNHVQFPDLTSNIFIGSTGYKFNDNYSVRSTISQTEAQLKSAGSFIPGLDYWLYDLDGMDKYINKEGDEVFRENYMKSSGFDVVLNLGYFYTFVYKKWYANAFAIPGIGVDFNKTTHYTLSGSSKQNSQDLLLSLNGGVGIGFNGEKIFYGAAITKKYTNEKDNENKIQFNTSKDSFFVFFGYRFKAPKRISKPIDDLEEKIPLLKKD